MTPITVNLPRRSVDMAFMKKGLMKIMEEPQSDFEQFVATWRPKNRPKIILEVKDRPKSLIAFTGVKSNWSKGKKATSEDKFMFLARGTSKRHTWMHPKFKPKTRRGQIRSGAGGGDREPVRLSKKPIAPGIEARDIEKAVKNKRKQKIVRDVKSLYLKTASRMGLALI